MPKDPLPASSNVSARSQWGAWLCVAALLACVFISHPVAEIGICDDWSYIRSAQLMAQTGRFEYVGWASAMLGWMLPLGALFIKLFGFSFTVVRAASVLIACGTAYLFQRCFVRAGLSSWNATITALTFVLSPIYLPLATTYMTDLAGVFATLICLYCCLRALQADNDFKATVWLSSGSVLTAVGGTARQTAWLALFVMIPSAAWLLQKRRLNWVGVLVVWLASVAFTRASMVWFSHQPYSLREAVVAGYVDRDLLYNLIEHVTRATLDSFLILLPITLAYAAHSAVRSRQSRRWYGGAIVVTVLLLAATAYRHTLVSWLAPFDENYFTEKGLVDMPEIGVRGTMLAPWFRVLLTALVWLCGTLTVGYFLARRKQKRTTNPVRAHGFANTRPMAVLLLPYTAIYSALLVHRAIFSHVFDRYLLAVLFAPAILLVLHYQEEVAPRLPNATIVLLILLGAFTTAANHDLFSMERARVRLANELIQAGVPRTEFYGGWEYDGWTQLERYGFANSGYMNTPHGFTERPPILLTMTVKPCKYWAARIAAAVQPKYAISFDQTSCGGPAPFAPVEYQSWLPPYGSKLYVQRVLEKAY